MSNPILPNAASLMIMTEDELRDELTKPIYNSANSHEIIRRMAKLALTYAEQRDKYKDELVDYRGAVRLIRQAMEGIEES